jgi:hypothetical protein
LLSNIRNNWKKGFRNGNNDPELTLISLKSFNAALAAQITLLDINLASAFLFTDSSTAPVLLGSKNGLYYHGVTDGFILRDATSSCLEID